MVAEIIRDLQAVKKPGPNRVKWPMKCIFQLYKMSSNIIIRQNFRKLFQFKSGKLFKTIRIVFVFLIFNCIFGSKILYGDMHFPASLIFEISGELLPKIAL